MARALMVQGTTSNAGKSWMVTALCRLLHQEGWRVAPFKAQNMSLNACVTPEGGEIAYAQALQAEAAGVVPTVDMNPVLLKPQRDTVAELLLRGRAVCQLAARDYQGEWLERAWQAVQDSFATLAQRYECIVIEGAGSPAEVNLRDRDLANMRLATWAGAQVLLVADIDRGGVFAQLVGTLELLLPEERELVRGLVINKFRGELSLLEPGLHFLEARTAKPVLGVLPYEELPALGAEDSLSLGVGGGEGELEVVVVQLPRISNFNDVEPLSLEPDVSLRFARHPRQLGHPDLVIIPGTKNTLEALFWMRQAGWDRALRQALLAGTFILGICGGYQLLGEELVDPGGWEGDSGTYPGLGFLPVTTVFAPGKVTRRRRGRVVARHWLVPEGVEVEGYELHRGLTRAAGEAQPLFLLEGEREGAWSGRVAGTYLHDLLASDGFRRAWLDALRRERGLPPRSFPPRSYRLFRERSLDRMADLLRGHLRLELIYSWLQKG
ncbi:cobyric acid synthase [Desulfothermobacter acidiphilus]|uniref:cobyric acid synthase n=1 Tax=Desulfothermobacter acidiphilus TaxID=1938353 RepID=UPI003F89CABE